MSDRVVTNVGCYIGVNESKCMRTVLIKGLLGTPDAIMAFIKTFNKRAVGLIR
jgi:hypothetical protein